MPVKGPSFGKKSPVKSLLGMSRGSRLPTTSRAVLMAVANAA